MNNPNKNAGGSHWRMTYDPRSSPPPPPPGMHRGYGPPPPHGVTSAASPVDPRYGPRPPMYHAPPPPYGYAPPPGYRYAAPPPHAAPRPPYYAVSHAAHQPNMFPMAGGGCTCKKSKCLKLYCQCFSSSTTCGAKCKCLECQNTSGHQADIAAARKVILERNPSAFPKSAPPTFHHPNYHNAQPVPTPPSTPKGGCKCRRSFCLKKYCECFNRGLKCADVCKCINCRNEPEIPPYTKATTGKSAGGEVSMIHGDGENSPECISNGGPKQDALAIMAAVAMTELLGGKRHSTSSSGSSQSPQPPSESPPCKKIKTTLTTESPPQDERAIVSSSSSSSSSSPEPTRPYPTASPDSLASYASPPPQFYAPPQPYTSATRRKMYEEATRLSGLPKSLSFRKICSKCGKTRGEHGELGFGHRCVFQECGKCGAGIQMHYKKNAKMGILCTLTEKDGAIPGAAASYQRKISSLALRAELQQKLQRDRAKTKTSVQ